MRKYFNWLALFLCILALCGCGSGGGSAADPMGTGTVQFIDETGAVLFPKETGGPMIFTVMPGESRHLIVWVTNARDGGATIVPVIGEEVAFSLLTPGNGGSITMVNNETDGNGRAVAIYTAGNNFMTDEVQVTTGVGAAAHVTITKLGGIVGSSITTLSAASSAVLADHTTLVTAYVTDGYGNPVVGEPVTFTLPVNESGASFSEAGVSVSSILVVTDISGKAVAIYKAGSNSPFAEVYDTVRGALANGSNNWVTITRSAGTVSPTTDLSVSVAASPASVSVGQTSIITATVTGAESSGAAVTFSLPVNSSGASFINTSGSSVSSITVTASGSGIATAIYQAGSASSGILVQDTVQTVLTNGANGAVILTRTAGATTMYAVNIEASTTSLKAGEVSIITATVNNTSGTTSTPAGGVTVTFALPVNRSGATLSPATATTDGAGKAVVIYQPGTTSPTLILQDTVQAAVDSATSALTITRSGSSTTAYAVSIEASTTTVKAGEVSIITATVNNTSGTTSTPAGGVTVIFTLPVNGSGATLSASSAVTDGAGNAVVTYKSGSNSPALNAWDTVQAAVGSATSAVAITREGTSTSTTTYAVKIEADPTSVTAGQVSVITAEVTTTDGSPAGGVTVIFSLPVNSSGATLSSFIATTDGAGKAVVVYQPGTLSPTLTVQDTVQAAVGTATSAVAITRTGSAASAYGIIVTPSTSTLPIGGGSSVITANVTNSEGTPISGVTVNFTTTDGALAPASATTDASGNAVTVFTGAGGAAGTTAGVVTASITIGVNTYTAAVVITY